MRRPKNAKQPKRSAAEKLSQLLEIPVDAFTDMMRLEIAGNRELIVENYKGIMQYEKDIIKVSSGRFILVLKGSNMEIKNMNETGLLIAGEFTGIEFLS